jgi:predicted nucleotidyltransferase
MISDVDKRKIQDLARRYGVKRLILFGSSAREGEDGRDIDLAIEGFPPGLFFRLYGDLLLSLSKPVDLVDISEPSKFSSLIIEEGVPLYDASQP